MKRFYGIAAAVFLGLMTIALVGGESTAVAGHGCSGASDCSGDDCSTTCSSADGTTRSANRAVDSGMGGSLRTGRALCCAPGLCTMRW